MARFSQLSSFTTGRISNALSGTPVQGADNELPPGVKLVLKSLNTNTGVMTVGNSSANALNTGTTAFRLQPGESLELEIENTDRVWVDATVAGEAVEFIMER